MYAMVIPSFHTFFVTSLEDNRASSKQAQLNKFQETATVAPVVIT